MALGTGDIHTIIGGTVSIVGANDGDCIHVKSGTMRAVTVPAHGEEVIDATGPGDAGIFFGFAGNRRFLFSLEGRYTRGTRDLHSFTKSMAAMDLKFDTGDPWKGEAVILTADKANDVFSHKQDIDIKLTGMISQFTNA